MNIDVLIVNVNLDLETTDGCEAIRARLAELRDDLTYAIVHWRAPDLAARTAAARGVLLGPNETPFPAYPDDLQGLLAWVRDQPGPLLGICGGHQVLALAHGASVGPVHDVPAATTTYANMPKVSGMTTARIVRDDRLIEGLPPEVRVASSHVDEVKSVPEGFRLVLKGEISPIQLMAHEVRPLWGAQFHPERGEDDGAGSALLSRWLDLFESEP